MAGVHGYWAGVDFAGVDFADKRDACPTQWTRAAERFVLGLAF
jgi:hypothetical protein